MSIGSTWLKYSGHVLDFKQILDRPKCEEVPCFFTAQCNGYAIKDALGKASIESTLVLYLFSFKLREISH